MCLVSRGLAWLSTVAGRADLRFVGEIPQVHLTALIVEASHPPVSFTGFEFAEGMYGNDIV